MKKEQIIFWSVLGAVVIGGGTFIYFKWFKKPNTNKDEGDNTSNLKTGGSGSRNSTQKKEEEPQKKSGNDKFPLIKGSQGENVEYLQRALIRLGSNIKVTGDFDQSTYNAVLLKAGTNYYPVTIDNFNYILKKSNNKQ